MTLDCNCLELRALRTQPLPEWQVYVTEEGERGTKATDLDTQMDNRLLSLLPALISRRLTFILMAIRTLAISDYVTWRLLPVWFS